MLTNVFFRRQLRQVRSILALMKHKLGIVFMMSLGAVVLTSCGSSDPTGVAGIGLVCASDRADVGETAECPNGDIIDFCVDGRNGSCYYVVDGEQVSCGNCLESANVTACAQAAVERCNQ